MCREFFIVMQGRKGQKAISLLCGENNAKRMNELNLLLAEFISLLSRGSTADYRTSRNKQENEKNKNGKGGRGFLFFPKVHGAFVHTPVPSIWTV
ncbi:hypothetical protein CEXT_87341 [Caerostris extrusa]|uniref:Uncharacterized protein n=1 Tax=Caerostris extrusa TaxID=172846 RepID=A0AAV4WL90_CAEEX|nr:hypothetical protein CEXT_87341 [Caerostris extrusa]